MSLGHGPKLVTKGLVFAYDMSLPVNDRPNKSWKGKPAVNTWYNDSYNFTNAATFSIVTDYPSTQSLPIEARGKKVIKLIADTPGTLGQCIPWRSGVDQVNGGTYNHSVWCYLESGSVVTVGQHWNPWDYGSSQYPPLGKWVRLNDPVTNSANNYGNIANAYRTDGVAYFTAPQYELGTDMSPFVHGTRSNTEAIIDIAGNNTITANSLTYNSDGTFEFDGSANYATLNSSIDTYGKSFTLDAWVYSNSTSGFKGIIGDLQYYWFQFAVNGSSPYLRYGYYVNGSETRMTLNGTSGKVPANTWTNITAVMESGVGNKLYVNGVLDVSNTNGNPFGISGTSRGPKYIGRADASSFGASPNWFNGKIGSLKGYSDVALSAAEVKQNFQALRGRYGI